jgi:hypothetical protein
MTTIEVNVKFSLQMGITSCYIVVYDWFQKDYEICVQLCPIFFSNFQDFTRPFNFNSNRKEIAISRI